MNESAFFLLKKAADAFSKRDNSPLCAPLFAAWENTDARTEKTGLETVVRAIESRVYASPGRASLLPSPLAQVYHVACGVRSE